MMRPKAAETMLKGRRISRAARTAAKIDRPRVWRQAGFVVGTELMFLGVICIVGCISFTSYMGKIIAEWSDIASAIGSLDQTYSTSGMQVFHANDPVHDANNPIASWAGSSFSDNTDFCDEGCDCGVVMCLPATGPEAHNQ